MFSAVKFIDFAPEFTAMQPMAPIVTLDISTDELGQRALVTGAADKLSGDIPDEAHSEAQS